MYATGSGIFLKGLGGRPQRGAAARRVGKSLLPKTEKQGLARRGEQTQGPGAGLKE